VICVTLKFCGQARVHILADSLLGHIVAVETLGDQAAACAVGNTDGLSALFDIAGIVRGSQHFVQTVARSCKTQDKTGGEVQVKIGRVQAKLVDDVQEVEFYADSVPTLTQQYSKLIRRLLPVVTTHTAIREIGLPTLS
jgi:hypothetical protein